MFAVNKPIEGPIFPKDKQWFGDSFLLFTNTREFLLRVDAAAKRQGLKGEAGLVKYFDQMKYSGAIGRFRKPSTYAYQSEFRIVLETGAQGHFRFEIGNLRDISSEVFSLEDADDILKFKPEDAEAAGLRAASQKRIFFRALLAPKLKKSG
jgi:hypothetical protein